MSKLIRLSTILFLHACFASALNAGVAVRFWLAAYSVPKTSLHQLHYIWVHGRGLGFIPAIRAGSQARKVALVATAACITQFLAAPLLQRSTFQTLQDRVTTEVMSIDVARRIPEGWFGPRDSRGEGLFEFRNGLSELQQWWRKDPISTHDRVGYACNGTCDAHVQAAGFGYECWTVQEELDMGTADSDNQTVFSIFLAVVQNATDEPPFLRVRTSYLSHVDR